MVRLLLVGDETRLTGNKENEIIAVYDDDVVIGNIEQQCINDGLFKLIEIDDTIENVRVKIRGSQPRILMCWEDKDTGEIKQLEKKPQYSTKYNEGIIESTLILIEENHVLANQSVKDELIAIKNELLTKEISLDCMTKIEPITKIESETIIKG